MPSLLAMNHRFFIENLIQSDHVTIEGPEAHHLLHVVRIQMGQEVTLLDGSGYEFQARVVNCERRSAQLEIVSKVLVDRELSWELVVGVALPKGERQRWLVEKATELGVTELIPLTTERSVSEPTDRAVQRLQRTVVEASKQCGRTVMMRIRSAQTLSQYLESVPLSNLRLIAHPSQSAESNSHISIPRPQNDSQAVHLAFGPEGGFTDNEWQQACCLGWQTVDLGPRILRIETSAIALIAALVLNEKSTTVEPDQDPDGKSCH